MVSRNTMLLFGWQSVDDDDFVGILSDYDELLIFLFKKLFLNGKLASKVVVLVVLFLKLEPSAHSSRKYDESMKAVYMYMYEVKIV